jgi:hypothetical protein
MAWVVRVSVKITPDLVDLIALVSGDFDVISAWNNPDRTLQHIRPAMQWAVHAPSNVEISSDPSKPFRTVLLHSRRFATIVTLQADSRWCWIVDRLTRTLVYYERGFTH